MGALGVAAALVLAPARAAAAGPSRSYSVSYAAPASCPPRDAFTAAIRARAPEAELLTGDAAVAFDARLTAEGTLASGVFTVRFVSGERFEREIPAAACDDVTTTMAIMAGLLLSGALLPEPPRESSEAPVSDERARLGEEPPPLALPVAVAPAASERPANPLTRRAEPQREESPAFGRFRAGVFADARLDFGVAPFPAFGVVAGFEARLARPSWFSPSLRAAFVYVTGDATAPPLGGARLRLRAATVRACPLAVPLGRRLAVDACAVFEGGTLTASPRATPDALGDASMPWLAFGAAARGELALAGPLAVEAELSGFGLVHHDAFALEPGPVVAHDVPAFSGAFSLGLVARFPEPPFEGIDRTGSVHPSMRP